MAEHKMGTFQQSPEGVKVFEMIQQLYAEYDLDAANGIALAGDLLVWAVAVAMARKEDAIEQVSLMVPGLIASIEENWPHLEAFRKAIEDGEKAKPGKFLQ